MKSLKKLYRWNIIIDVIVAVLFLTTIITLAIYVNSSSTISLALLIIQVVIIIMLVMIDDIMLMNKYKVICGELTDMVRDEIIKSGYKSVAISCDIIRKKNYCIVELRVHNKLEQQIYSKCCNLSIDYLQEAEELTGNTFLLTVLADD